MKVIAFFMLLFCNQVFASGRPILVFERGNPNAYLESNYNSIGNRFFQHCSTNLAINDAKCETVGKADGYIPANIRYRWSLMAGNRDRTYAAIAAGAVTGLGLGFVASIKVIPQLLSRWASPLAVVVEAVVGAGRGMGPAYVGSATLAAGGYGIAKINNWLMYDSLTLDIGQQLSADQPMVITVDNLRESEAALLELLSGL